MGYSCSIAAGNGLTFILNNICFMHSSNTWEFDGDTYFFERGRENRDGAITGKVMKIIDDQNHCRKVGAVRIEPSGYPTRFPAIPTRLRLHAREKAMHRDFEPTSPLITLTAPPELKKKERG